METVTRFTERQISAVSPISTAGPEMARTLSVTATYLLTENGRKASLLTGGDGHSLQHITLHVPANRLHLVSVDKQGVARLKLRPRFESDAERGIVRIDAIPVYDEPPAIDELYRAAAKNHELETAYFAARETARSKRGEVDRAFREAMAEAFLEGKGQRAVIHPPPTPKRCYVDSNKGRLLFDVATDLGRAKDVPAEAHRRFRADLRERDERNRKERATQLAVHGEKKAYIAEWIAANGTEEQKSRQAAGMLPMEEATERMTDQAFAAVAHLPVYIHDGASRLQRFLRETTGQTDLIVAPEDVTVRSRHAVKATAPQWEIVEYLKGRLPDTNIVFREHLLSSKRQERAEVLTTFGALVTKRLGPFVLRREYLVDPYRLVATDTTMNCRTS